MQIKIVKMRPSLSKAALRLPRSKLLPSPPFTSSFQCLKHPNPQRALASVARVSAPSAFEQTSSGVGHNQRVHVRKQPYSSSHRQMWSEKCSPRKITITTVHDKSWIWKKTYTYKTVQEARSRYRIGVRLHHLLPLSPLRLPC